MKKLFGLQLLMEIKLKINIIETMYLLPENRDIKIVMVK